MKRTRGPKPTGYSGTPLFRKLGIKEGARVYVAGAPEGFAKLLEPLPSDVRLVRSPSPDVGIAHVFVTDVRELTGHLRKLREQLAPNAAV